MLCKCYWIVLYIVHVIAFCLGGGTFFPDKMYKFKSSQAAKARLQSSKRTGAEQNVTQNGHSRSFKVTCFRVSGKAIRD